MYISSSDLVEHSVSWAKMFNKFVNSFTWSFRGHSEPLRPESDPEEEERVPVSDPGMALPSVSSHPQGGAAPSPGDPGVTQGSQSMEMDSTYLAPVAGAQAGHVVYSTPLVASGVPTQFGTQIVAPVTTQSPARTGVPGQLAVDNTESPNVTSELSPVSEAPVLLVLRRLLLLLDTQ